MTRGLHTLARDHGNAHRERDVLAALPKAGHFDTFSVSVNNQLHYGRLTLCQVVISNQACVACTAEPLLRRPDSNIDDLIQGHLCSFSHARSHGDALRTLFT